MRDRIYGLSFRLSDDFVSGYVNRSVSWGFGVLSEVSFLRSYSRQKDVRTGTSWPYDTSNLADFQYGGKEAWWETCERVISGMYSIQKDHVLGMRMEWDEEKAQKSAQEAYDRLFNLKWSPAGRGLWAMGTYLVNHKKDSSALYNCFFVSTKDIDKDFTEPFTFLMDASMMGGGVGFDTRGEYAAVTLQEPTGAYGYRVPDSREGWVRSVELLLKAYVKGGPLPRFDYSAIRAEGEPIITFGGTAPGPKPLKGLHRKMKVLLDGYVDCLVDSRLIVDLMNLIGVAVVSGNVRRSAELALGNYEDDEFWHLKDYSAKNRYRRKHGWMSNNSLIVDKHTLVDYDKIARRIAREGEPGLFYIDNARNYGRMRNGPDFLDENIEGANPCVEIGLEDHEACNLIEQFINNADDLNDFMRTQKFVYLYGKTVTLLPTHWPKVNQKQLRNRRIGASLTGVAQFVDKYGYEELHSWMDLGYETIREWDEEYSRWLCVRESIKVTAIKPSGTVSLLAGSTAGVHWPTSNAYLRRITLSKDSSLVGPLKEAGYRIERSAYSPGTSVVAEIPILVGDVRSEEEVSIFEKIGLVALAQEHWADNMVSNTQVFDPYHEVEDLAAALRLNAKKLKSVSALPRSNGVYAQMPEEPFPEGAVRAMQGDYKPVDFSDIYNGYVLSDDAQRSLGCDTDVCEIPSRK